MARLFNDRRYDHYDWYREYQDEKTFEELKEEADRLNKRYEEILKLPKEEFMSDEVTRELYKIHNDLLRISKEMLEV